MQSDGDFQRQIRDARSRIGQGVLLGGPVQEAPKTLTEVTLQNNSLVMVRLANDEGTVVGYQMRLIDPFLNRVIIFTMSPENARDFFADFEELLTGVEEGDEEQGTG